MVIFVYVFETAKILYSLVVTLHFCWPMIGSLCGDFGCVNTGEATARSTGRQMNLKLLKIPGVHPNSSCGAVKLGK
jgi:hypothetical protein